ncbi:MAG: hypothetical protein IPJ07_18360 [Acidobacteria bacterium]|nr:hypothetical protein [Acidobacteriota bacterium]
MKKFVFALALAVGFLLAPGLSSFSSAYAQGWGWGWGNGQNRRDDRWERDRRNDRRNDRRDDRWDDRNDRWGNNRGGRNGYNPEEEKGYRDGLDRGWKIFAIADEPIRTTQATSEKETRFTDRDSAGAMPKAIASMAVIVDGNRSG